MKHPNFNRSDIFKFYKHPYSAVREHVVMQKDVPTEILEAMTEDSSPDIAEHARFMVAHRKEQNNLETHNEPSQ
jgi:hypothetical protein